MKTYELLKKTIFTVVLVFISYLAFSQSKQITIRFIGNCGLHITDGKTNLYIDFPYKSGAFNYMEYDQEEISNLEEKAYYIFTHKHADHYYRGKMNGILRDVKGKKYGKWNIPKLEKLCEEIPNFAIEAISTKHLFSVNHYSYLITWHGKKIYISGDTESADIISKIKNIDWAFVPAWIIRDAYITKDLKIDATNIAIYHIGVKDEIDITGENILLLYKQGEIISIPYE